MKIAPRLRLLSPALLALVLIAASQTSAAAGGSAVATLYDQTGNVAAGSANSQNFEATYDPYDNQAADDFVIPAGPSWVVNRVEVLGEYSAGTGPADSTNVTFYQNAGTIPGVEVASQPAVVPADGLATGDFGINLTPITLAPGHYWVSVQANLDLADAQWGWTEQTVQSNNPAAWRQPGDGYATGCTDWAARAATCSVGNDVDQAFRILGSLAPTLYDQTGNVGAGSSYSQNFDAPYDPYDNQTADDFVIPPGPSWIVNRVEVLGVYLSGPGPVDSTNVTFYQNAGSLPGVEVASQPAVVPADGLATGDFGIDLAPITLAPGHYWVSVQAIGDLSTEQWGWTERTVQSNNPAAWREPGNGFGSGCTAWAARFATCGQGSDVDQAFRILGSLGPPPPAPFTPSFNLGGAKAKEGKPITFLVNLSAAPTQPFVVPFATQAGSAKSGKDFKAASGNLTFAPGETSKTVVVKTKDDHKDEKNKETFSLQLTTATGNVLLPAKIRDNDK